MKEIETIKAVGHILCQDITQIIPGVKKAPVFRKGHRVREEDIPVLLSVGKERLYVWEKTEGMLHENEAAEILYDICSNEGMKGSEIKEGKIEITTLIDGLFKINRKKLLAINNLGEIIIATRHGDTEVRQGDKLAGTRVIPLVIEKEKLDRAVEIAAGEGILKVLPFKHKKVAIVTTGSEVFKGRIKDGFGPVLRNKLSYYPTEVIGQTIVDDSKENIREAIMNYIEQGADMVICTGGMSVDPDDRTPGAIMSTGASVVTYGAPVLPGSMLLLSYYHKEGREIPILGLPGCVMYDKKTIFDLILPRLMAEDPITAEELNALGEGGLCLHCDICTFPNCGFGKSR